MFHSHTTGPQAPTNSKRDNSGQARGKQQATAFARGPAIPGSLQRAPRPACINMHRPSTREVPSAANRVFRTAMAPAPLSDVNAGRVCHLDAEADRRSRGKGRAAGTQARTIQLPQAPSAWIRAGDRHQPWIIGVPRTLADGQAGERRGRTARHCAAVNGCLGTSVSLPGITLSDEEVRENALGPAVNWSPNLGVFAVSAAGVLCAFPAWWTRYLDSVSAARMAQIPLSLLYLELSSYVAERCSATCQRRRRPGQARRRQGRLQIMTDLRGRRLDAHYDTGRPDLGILRAMSRRARGTLVYVLGSARPGQEAGTNLTNSR